MKIYLVEARTNAAGKVIAKTYRGKAMTDRYERIHAAQVEVLPARRISARRQTDVNRIAIAEAGVRRCFARRHEGRYAFMPYEDAVRHCRKWIAALRDMRMEK